MIVVVVSVLVVVTEVGLGRRHGVHGCLLSQSNACTVLPTVPYWYVWFTFRERVA
jgi:hypothetical protein